MEIYDVGPDSLYDASSLSDNYIWLVSDYERGDYCGSGSATAMDKEGLLHHFNLGHCSCYGPLDDCGVGEIETVEKYLSRFNDVTELVTNDKVHSKILELLGR